MVASQDVNAVSENYHAIGRHRSQNIDPCLLAGYLRILSLFSTPPQQTNKERKVVPRRRRMFSAVEIVLYVFIRPLPLRAAAWAVALLPFRCRPQSANLVLDDEKRFFHRPLGWRLACHPARDGQRRLFIYFIFNLLCSSRCFDGPGIRIRVLQE